MKKINTVLTSMYTKSIMDSHPKGVVHSVYNKSINICFGDRLISINSNATVPSPISIILDIDDNAIKHLGIEQGNKVNYDTESIVIGDKYFFISQAKLWDSCVNGQSSPDYTVVKACLSELSNRGGFYDISLPESNNKQRNFITKKASEILETCSRQLDSSPLYAASTLSHVIGLGEGLTPSGDDFLSGLLFYLHTAGGSANETFKNFLIEKIMQSLKLTNDISAAFLKCACEGHFSFPLIELKNNDINLAISNFSKIGHSSGVDTLNGIIFGLINFEK